jgi:hypothetical protein
MHKVEKTPLGFFAIEIALEKIKAKLSSRISDLRNRVILKVGNRVTLIQKSSHSFEVRTRLKMWRSQQESNLQPDCYGRPVLTIEAARGGG